MKAENCDILIRRLSIKQQELSVEYKRHYPNFHGLWISNFLETVAPLGHCIFKK